MYNRCNVDVSKAVEHLTDVIAWAEKDYFFSLQLRWISHRHCDDNAKAHCRCNNDVLSFEVRKNYLLSIIQILECGKP